MHISEFTGAFRSQYGKYRTSEMISDAKVEALFKMYARKVLCCAQHDFPAIGVVVLPRLRLAVIFQEAYLITCLPVAWCH